MDDELSRLTTIDNPYDPFDEFVNWFMYDNEKGYDTCGLVANLYIAKPNETEFEIQQNTEAAIDRFLAADPSNMYVKVQRGEFKQKKELFKKLWNEIQKESNNK